MARGKPDYLDIQTQTAIPETLNGGSYVYDTGFSRLDGGGRVVFFEDFRTGITRYDLSSVAPGVNPVMVSSPLIGQGFYPSVKLTPTGANGYSIITGRVTVPVSGKMGLEFGFYFPSLHGQLIARLIPIYYSGTNKSGDLRIRHFQGQFDVYAGNAYQTVYTPTDGALLQTVNLQCKMVIDSINGIYDSIIIGGNRIALGQALSNLGGGGIPGLVTWTFQAFGYDATFKNEAYLNYVVITADEP